MVDDSVPVDLAEISRHSGWVGPEKIFVSSTCYDLIDLRAELREHLLSMGLVPILSDAEDFRVETSQNSIETCLVRLRESNIVLMILDSRYGPSLGPDFGNVSATHLEYIEARKLGKPIHVFVRDRVRGAMETWKKAADKTGDFLPVKSKDAANLFPWIVQHEKLAAAVEHSNWTHTFASSVDLRAKVSVQLEREAERAFLRRGLENGTIPIPAVWAARKAVSSNSITISFRIKDQGANPVSDVVAIAEVDRAEWPSLEIERTWEITRPWNGAEVAVPITVEFGSIQGARLGLDVIVKLVVGVGLARVVFRRLRLISALTIELG